MGNIIKVSGGKMRETSLKDYTAYAERIKTNAAQYVKESSSDGILFGEPQTPPVKEADFDIRITLLKDKDTLLPLGITSFKGQEENKSLKFKITITGEGVNQWQLEIKSKDQIIYKLYSATNELQDVEIQGTASKNKNNTPAQSPVPPTEKPKRFWPAGEYLVAWDGFNSDGIYDSFALTKGKKFIATIKGQANFRSKEANTDPFSFKYDGVEWVDMKIDKTTKIIEVTLRVNLQDGGAKGIDPVKMGGTVDPDFEYNPWDRIPPKKIEEWKKTPIKSRIRSFDQLKQMTLAGLKQYWSRSQSNKTDAKLAKDVMISKEPYQVNLTAVHTENNALNPIDLVFNTNDDWDRSGNPGILAKLSYNAGYIKYSNGWGYQEPTAEDAEFSFTAAHEIGHPILKAFGNYAYSWQHKGSSYLLNQDPKPTPDAGTLEKVWKDNTHIDHMPSTSGEYYPVSGEVDLMKYYHNEPNPKTFSRSIAAERDVLGLLWLTKLKIE
jgi:hypothetical protein